MVTEEKETPPPNDDNGAVRGANHTGPSLQSTRGNVHTTAVHMCNGMIASVAPPQDSDCPTCLANVCHKATIACDHVFCFGCIQKWSQKHRELVCPLCKTPFDRIFTPMAVTKCPLWWSSQRAAKAWNVRGMPTGLLANGVPGRMVSTLWRNSPLECTVGVPTGKWNSRGTGRCAAYRRGRNELRHETLGDMMSKMFRVEEEMEPLTNEGNL